jgi:hypothetical protein
MSSEGKGGGLPGANRDDPQEERSVLAATCSHQAAGKSQTEDVRIETTILEASFEPGSSLQPILLERIEPSLGRGERLLLDASKRKLSVGRAESNDVRLYTASASREHAVIAGNDDSEWVLTPSAGKSVMIDGEITTEPVVLEVGLNIILGQDHLRCVAADPDLG